MLKKKEKQHIVANEKAITLIALVVTIVILLILAGVTITMTLGQNGLFTRARDGRAAYEEAEVRDDLSMLITQYTWDKASEKTDKSLGDYLKENGASNVKENPDGKTLDVEYKDYVFTVDKDSGDITGVSKKDNSGDMQPEVVVNNVKVTEDSAGQGSDVKKASVEADSGKKLYITFTSSIEGGTTTVSPVLPFEVSQNGSYKFTITGTVGEKTYPLEYTVIVNQYKVKVPQVGDIVSYTPDTPSTDYDLSTAKSGYSKSQTIDDTYDPTTWKIMKLDENGNITKLLGIGSKNVYLHDFTGYNNGVYVLNDICKNRYGNTKLGATARSLKIEDIESRMNDDGIAARNAFMLGTTQYGATKKYTGYYAEYPAIYAQEKYSGVNVSDVPDGTQVITGNINATAQAKMNPNGRTQSEDIYTSPTEETYKTDATNLTCTQTFYHMSNPSSYFDDSNFYNMMFGTRTSFWMASRFAECESSDFDAYWGLDIVYYNNLDGYILCNSNGGSNTDSNANRLAPVVSFDSGIQVKSGSGTTEKPYVIGK